MLKNSYLTLVIVSVLGAAIFGITGLINPDSVSANALERGPRGGQSDSTTTRGRASGTGIVLSPLSDEEVDGLIRAIYEEYNARNTYLAVIDQFGPEVPFVQIANSEQNHLNALLRQADKYGIEVPELAPTAIPSLATLEDACSLGVAAEIADAALYDELIADVTHTDLIQVYSRLQTASLQSHLPQFELCQ